MTCDMDFFVLPTHFYLPRFSPPRTGLPDIMEMDLFDIFFRLFFPGKKYQ